MIPKKIYFTHKTAKPPAAYIEIIERWHAFCPEWELHYFSDEKVFKFFQAHFPEYAKDLAKIPMGAILADVFRYAVLYVQGGMYTDIDTIPVKAIPEEWLSYQAVIGYEFQPSKFPQVGLIRKEECEVFCQWTLLSQPRVSLFKEALDLSFQKMRANNFEIHDERDTLTSAGPLTFTSVVEKHLPSKEILILDMDYFGVWENYLTVTDRTVVKHLFHGYEGWKLQLEHPQLKFY
ncbi:glycosyltransferase family 32 protein [Simkania sp.]|uniref:glycosyltransferase family 32 protein n=1 Tax=Simkania sp. TaxID=34094 RepID=UPI003B5272BB